MAGTHLRVTGAGDAPGRGVATFGGAALRGRGRVVGHAAVQGRRVGGGRLGQPDRDGAVGRRQHASLRVPQGPRVSVAVALLLALRARAVGAQSLRCWRRGRRWPSSSGTTTWCTSGSPRCVSSWPCRTAARPPCPAGDGLRGADGCSAGGTVYSIHHFAGLGFYVRSNIESTRHEAERTDLEWPAFESAAGRGLLRKRGERRLVDLLPVPAAAGGWAGAPPFSATAAGGAGRRWFPRGAGDAGSLRRPAEPLPPSRQPRGQIRRSRRPDGRAGCLADRACPRACRAARRVAVRARGTRGHGDPGHEHGRECVAGTGDVAPAGRRSGRRPVPAGRHRTRADAAGARGHGGRTGPLARDAQRGGLPEGLHGSERPYPRARRCRRGGGLRGPPVCGGTSDVPRRLLYAAGRPGVDHRAPRPAVRADRDHA